MLQVPNLSNLTNLVKLLLSDGSCNTGKSNLITECNLCWIWTLSRLKKLCLNLLNVPVPPNLASLSHMEKLTLSHLDLETLGQLQASSLTLNLKFLSIRWAKLPLSYLRLRNLSTLELCYVEVDYIPLDGLPQLENLTVMCCELLQSLFIPLQLRKLRQAWVILCPELVEIKFMDLSKSLVSFLVFECESLRKIYGLSYLKNLANLEIQGCNLLTIIEGLNDLESLEYLEVGECTSLRRLIDISHTNIPDNCRVLIRECRGLSKDFAQHYPSAISLKHYREEILLDTSSFESKSDEMEHPFTIIFHVGVKKSNFEFVGGIMWESEGYTSNWVT